MKLLNFLLPFILFISLDVNAEPKIPNFGQNSASKFISKSKPKKTSSIKQHDGYKVTDSKGKEFWVDDIKNPKHQVIVNQVNIERKRTVKSFDKDQIKQDVNIGKLCFTSICQ